MTIQPKQLPAPAAETALDLIAALRLRRSTREYAQPAAIDDVALSTLLWACNGVNGPEDKRTAPSAFGGNQVWIYVTGPQGTFRYDASAHALTPLSERDSRAGLCPDEWTATGALSIILTGRTDQFPDFVTPAYAIELLQATAGCIAENLHLMAAALGLGTCMVGHMNVDVVRQALALPAEEIPLYVMPVGRIKS